MSKCTIFSSLLKNIKGARLRTRQPPVIPNIINTLISCLYFLCHQLFILPVSSAVYTSCVITDSQLLSTLLML